jgi:hypothetical protein
MLLTLFQAEIVLFMPRGYMVEKNTPCGIGVGN